LPPSSAILFVLPRNEDAMPHPGSQVIQDNADFQRIHAAFAHIGTRLALLWGYPEFHVYVQQIQQDTRQGSRTGFPADVLFALLNLVQAHDDAFPALAPAGNSLWGQSNFR
jgi:hypothetical protein